MKLPSRDETTANVARECFAAIFAGDTQGGVTFTVVRQLAGIMKSREYRIPPESVRMCVSDSRNSPDFCHCR